MAESETESKATEKARPVSPGAFEDMERWTEEYLPRAWMRRWGWPSWGELTRPLERMAPRVDAQADRDKLAGLGGGVAPWTQAPCGGRARAFPEPRLSSDFCR